MMRIFRILLFLVSVGTLVSAGSWCAPTSVLPVRILDTDDDAPSALVFAGHASRQQFMRLTFSANATAVALIPPGSALLAELGGGELDDTSIVTMPRLLVSWRQTTALWRAAIFAGTNTPLLHFGPLSSWWLRYSTLVYTGAELVAFGHTCNGGGPDAALARYTGNNNFLPLATGPDAPPVAVQVRCADQAAPVAEWPAVQIRVDLDRGQTLLPPDVFAELLVAGCSLVLPGGIVLVDADEARTDALVAPDITQLNATTIVLGRRLGRRVLAAWAANASGVVSVAFTVRDQSSTGVAYMLLATGLVAAYLLSFWTTALGPYIGVLPVTVTTGDDTPSTLGTRTLRHLVLLCASGTIAHAFGTSFIGTGPVMAVDLVAPLRTFALGFFLPGSLMNFVLLIAAGFRVFMSSGDTQPAWLVLMATHCVLVTRTLVVALLPAASRSLVSSIGAVGGILVLVLVPSIYICTVACVRVAAARRRDLPRWDLALAAVSIITLVLNGTGLYTCLLAPLLLAMNARFASSTIVAASVVVTALPIFVGTFLASMEENNEDSEESG